MGVCLRYCPSRAEAEDALQNTFVKIFTRLDQYRGQGPFEAWVRRIAVTTSLHALAQHRLRHPAPHADLNEWSAGLARPEPSAQNLPEPRGALPTRQLAHAACTIPQPANQKLPAAPLLPTQLT